MAVEEDDNTSSGLWFILPCLLILAVTSIYPLVFGFGVSLTDWNWGGRLSFVGARNYGELLSEPEFWTVVGNTLVFAGLATLIEVVLGFYLAVQVDKLPIRTDLIRAFLMVPLMVSGIVVALMSKVLLDPLLGVVNHLLGLAGYGPSAFYGAADTAMATVLGVDVWWQTGFVFIIALAGLQGLPRDPVEAAQLEGAGSFAIFWQIKFPLLKPLLLTVLVIRSIDTLKVFDIVFGTTGVMQTLAYRTAYGFLQIGRSMTIMMIFGAFILAICLLYDRAGHRGER